MAAGHACKVFCWTDAILGHPTNHIQNLNAVQSDSLLYLGCARFCNWNVLSSVQKSATAK